MKLIKRLWVAGLVLAPLGAFATDTVPLDLTDTGTTIAGYVGSTALLALPVFAAIYGVRIIMRSFKTVAK